jgi:hypothetical protein
VACKAAKWCFWLRSEHSWEPKVRLIWNFQTVSRETVRKGVRVTFRSWIWPVHGGQNEPKSTVSVARKATLQAPPRLFGQSQKRCSRKFAVASSPFRPVLEASLGASVASEPRPRPSLGHHPRARGLSGRRLYAVTVSERSTSKNRVDTTSPPVFRAPNVLYYCACSSVACMASSVSHRVTVSILPFSLSPNSQSLR